MQKVKKKKLPRRVVTVVPVKEYNASEVKKIRNETGMSQKDICKLSWCFL